MFPDVRRGGCALLPPYNGKHDDTVKYCIKPTQLLRYSEKKSLSWRERAKASIFYQQKQVSGG